MHGSDWDGLQDLTGWWMSEKIDGVRAFWNGKALMSRHSKEIPSPNWFTTDFPTNISLDGELWLGRGIFELLGAAIHSKDNSQWENVTFMVFDLPRSKEPYKSRILELATIKFPNHVTVLETKQCTGSAHLNEYLATVLAKGGEGVMVNQPNALYTPHRTQNLLKVKVVESF
jgi:DNA ligase-1